MQSPLYNRIFDNLATFLAQDADRLPIPVDDTLALRAMEALNIITYIHEYAQVSALALNLKQRMLS